MNSDTKPLFVIGGAGFIGSNFIIFNLEKYPNYKIIILDKLTSAGNLDKDESMIMYLEDRKGHDRRYTIDGSKIKSELGWSPKTNYEEGLNSTITWYKANEW